MRKSQTKTGGRSETSGVIPGDYALSVGKPDNISLAGWNWIKLSDVARLESGHTPSRRHPEYWNGDVPWVGIRDATANHGKTLHHTNQYTNELGIANSSARILPEKTVCLSRTASVGYVVVMGRPMSTSQDFVNWVCDPEKLDYQFLKYVLLAEKRSFLRFASGTTHQTIYFPEVKAFHICLPALTEQKAIAHILGSLDDKIELNRQMNETLESMAQALFKSWFVDFDPVIDNALAAGNTIPDVFAERAKQRAAIKASATQNDANNYQQLFPAEFEFTEEMGWIPLGWKVKEISDLVSSVSASYPLKEVDKVIFLNTGDIQEGRFLHTQYSDVNGLPGQAKKSIKEGDILYSEIRPKNKRFAYVYFDGSNHVVSTKLMVLRSVCEIKSLFTYFVLKQESSILYLQLMAESRSGTFPQITFDVLSKLKVILPTEPQLVDIFISIFLEPNFEKSVKLEKQNKVLSNLRDTLLPKLLSGELRIPDAEKLAQQATQSKVN